MSSPVAVGEHTKARISHDFGRVAGRGLLVAGLIYLLGNAVDLGVLWIGQYQDDINWEFVALNNTASALPDIIIAVALIYGGLYVMGSTRVWAYQTLAILFIALAIGSAVVLGLLILNYLSIASQVAVEATQQFRSIVVKTGALSVIYIAFLLPAGILGLRTRSR